MTRFEDLLTKDPFTTAQSADYLGVTVQTLYQYRSDGRGPDSFTVGRSVFYGKAALDAWKKHVEAMGRSRIQ